MILVLSQKMAHIVTLKPHPREDWLHQLADVITDPLQLLHFLALDDHPELRKGAQAHTLFPLRVPWSFAARMRKGDPLNPLLLQVLTAQDEFEVTPGSASIRLMNSTTWCLDYSINTTTAPCCWSKAAARSTVAIASVATFPIRTIRATRETGGRRWTVFASILNWMKFFSPEGDPLMAKDHELDWLITELETLPHVQRLRIHSRLPVVIPARITEALYQRLSQTRLRVLLVIHINHVNEIDSELSESMARLRQAGVTRLC